ncbi:MAG TPA: tetratricopeptide repeat protein [Phycisphaerae bacterium]|nr:tetratricopeptide repeat protein [Phycisphaerae bacterium]HRW55376.1 tetratricopeptide repeat protein [Phycisphaerae bacterium]
MNKGWFIPALIAGAAACTVAFWLYLDTSDSEPIARRFSPSPSSSAATKADTPNDNGVDSYLAALLRSDADAPSKGKAPTSTTPPIAQAPSPTKPKSTKPPAALNPRSEETRVVTAPPPAPTPEPTISPSPNPDVAKAVPGVATAPPPPARPSRRGALKGLKEALISYAFARLDSLDFLAMELDRNSLRWRSNLSRDPQLITLIAWIYYYAGDIDSADRAFVRATSLRPEYAPALRGRAKANMEQGRYAQATTALQDLCRAYPKDVDAHYNRGVLLTRVGRLGEASDAYRKALSINPKHVRSIYNLAAIAQHDGRLADARRLWDSFTSLEPNVVSVWFNLGVVHLDYNEPLEAARCFEAAVSINPEETVTQINLALAYMEAGHLEAAQQILEDADNESPCTPAILDALAEVNRRLADWAANRAVFLARAASIERELADMRPADMAYESVAGDPTRGESADINRP